MIPPKQPAPLRLAAIVPHTIARRGMEAVFDAAPEVDLIQMGVVSDDLEGFSPGDFDVVLAVVTVDSGYDGIRALHDSGHRVIAMGSPEHREPAIAAGAHAFVGGEAEPDVLIWNLVQATSDGPVGRTEPSGSALRLAIVVSNPLGRSLLTPLFDASRCRVVAAVTDPKQLEGRPAFDVMILGLGRDDPKERIDAATALGVPILCFGITEHREHALAAGVAGFMRGAETPDEILDAVESIAAGGSYHPESRASLTCVLSPREQEVLEHLARGRTDREIGDRLGISMRTVQSHLDRIREKTGRRRRAELTRLAIELGISTDSD